MKWTGSESGQALLTLSLGEKIFLSSAVASGLDEPGDTDILAMYLKSLESASIVHGIAPGKADPLGPLRNRRERPLLMSVVIQTMPDN